MKMLSFIITNHTLSTNPLPLLIGGVGVLMLIMGIVIFIHNHKNPVYFSFLMTNVSVFIWLFCQFLYKILPHSPEGHNVAEFFSKIEYTAVPFISFFFMLFVLSFLDLIKKYKILVSAIFISSLLFIVLIFTGNWFIKETAWLEMGIFSGYYTIHGILGPVFLVMFMFQAVFSFARLMTAYRQSKPGLGRDQMRDILIAYTIAYVSMLDFLPCYKISSVPPVGFGFILVFIIFLSRAMLKNRIIGVRHFTTIFILKLTNLAIFITPAAVILSNKNVREFFTTAGSVEFVVKMSFMIIISGRIYTYIGKHLDQLLGSIFKKDFDKATKIIEKMKSANDEKDVIQLLNKILYQGLRISKAALYIKNNNGKFTRIHEKEHETEKQNKHPEKLFEIPEEFHNQAVSVHETQYLPKFAFYRNEFRDLFHANHAHIFACLKYHNRRIAYLFITFSGRRHILNEEEKNLLNMMIHVLGGTLYGIRTSRRRLNELTKLYNTSRDISSFSSLEELYSSLQERINQIYKTETFSLFVLNEKSGKLTLKASKGLNKEKYDHAENILDLSPFMKKVMETQELIYKEDFHENLSQIKNYKNNSSFIILPLVSTDGLKGVLNINFHKDERKLASDDIQLLSLFAQQLANIIIRLEAVEKIKSGYFDTIQGLAATIDAKDKYTKGHSERVTEISLKIGSKLNLSEQQMRNLSYGAVLHDIGKIGIHETILNKPDRLTDKEYEVIKNHPVIGAEIINRIDFLKPVKNMVLMHHERFDGRGYPDGKSAEEIPVEARIIAVADTWDAMTSSRAYRKALDHKKALYEIKTGKSSQFDPQIADILTKLIEDGELL